MGTSFRERLRHLDRRSIVQWVGATLAAGFLGAFVNSVSSTATPEVVVSHMAPTRNHNDRFSPEPTVSLDPNDTTISGYHDSDWLTPIREPESPLSEVLEVVEANKSRVDRHLRSLERYTEAKIQLEQYLDGDGNPDAFFDVWEVNDSFISASVRGEFHRGQFDLPDDMPECREPAFLVTERSVSPNDIAGLFGQLQTRRVLTVSKFGGKFVSYLEPERDSDEELSEYFAKALACFDKESLRAMIEVAEKELQGRALHEQVQRGTETLLGSLSRWSVSVVVSNSGGRPVSVVPMAELIVDTRNTTINKPSVNIPLQHRDEDGNLTPIVVGPGEAKTVLFVSDQLVRDYRQWEPLYDMYQNRSRESHVIVDVLPRRLFSRERVETRRHPFGDGKAPRQPSLWSRIVNMF